MASRKPRARPLEAYNAKRDFARTAEPQGKVRRRGGDGFVIQKHAARALHYDFRLELDGVLLSWAVTKGPSLDTSVKRLAVRTEDHPVEYGSFEGTIPKGEYGGGTVLLWDRGRWEPREGYDPRDGLVQGMLKFDLHGERLTGGFALVRLKPRDGEKRENWLFIKEKDEFANRGFDPLEEWTTSVSTGRTLEQIASGNSAVWRSDRNKSAKTGSAKVSTRAVGVPSPRSRGEGQDEGPVPGDEQVLAPHPNPLPARGERGRRPAQNARALKMPPFVRPELATLVPEPPSGPEWVHEIKYDGYRVVAAVAGGKAKLYTRSGQDWTAKFDGVVDAVSALPCGSALLDGEVVAVDEDGKISFGALQDALKHGGRDLTYFVFDLLHLDGEDLRGEPLRRRKARLAKVLAEPPQGVAFSEHIDGDSGRVLAKACELGLEGLVSKRLDKPYVSARTFDWLKSKCLGRDEFVIGGYRCSDKSGRPFASLLLGEYEDGALTYRGRVGTGFDEKDFADLKRRFATLSSATNPFAALPPEARRGARWLKPKLVAEIGYAEFTSDGLLRQGRYLGLRGDKTAAEVKAMEKAKRLARTVGESKSAKAKPKSGVLSRIRLTHPGKVLIPAANLTKRDLAEYLEAVAPVMLPHVRDRPLSLVRCPDGSEGECFFQKHASRGMPQALKTIPVVENDGDRADYLALNTAEGLVSTAQIGALEIHIWGSAARAIEKPDRMVFDLDPGPGVTFEAVKQAARDVKDVLDAVGLASFPLLSGGKGIHVVAPLARRLEWPQVKAFSKGLATRLADDDPARFVATMTKAKREGRIFIDWMRNERGSTAIAPYSARARASAGVATPVAWNELPRVKSADAFSLSAVMKRVEGREGDPWEGYFDVRQTIAKRTLDLFGA